MRIMDITGSLAGATAAFELIGTLRNALSSRTISPEEIANRMMEIQQILLTLQRDLSQSAMDNWTLRKEIDELKSAADSKADIEYVEDGGYYVRRSEAIDTLIAYCPLCWGNNDKLVPMNRHETGSFFCFIHGVNFSTTKSRRRST